MHTANQIQYTLGKILSDYFSDVFLKDMYPNFEVGLKCILMVFPYLLLCSYINENAM